MAASYHQLGILAQARGAYPEAEARYRQALGINERLGNLADMATSTSQMGLLSSVRGRPADAVSWHVRALAIWLQVGVPQARIDVGALNRLREELGPERFVAVLAMSSMTPTGRA